MRTKKKAYLNNLIKEYNWAFNLTTCTNKFLCSCPIRIQQLIPCSLTDSFICYTCFTFRDIAYLLLCLNFWTLHLVYLLLCSNLWTLRLLLLPPLEALFMCQMIFSPTTSFYMLIAFVHNAYQLNLASVFTASANLNGLVLQVPASELKSLVYTN